MSVLFNGSLNNKQYPRQLNEIWEQIFPSKLRKEYEQLYKLIEEYKEKSELLFSSTKIIDNAGEGLSLLDEAKSKRIKMSNHLTAMLGQFNNSSLSDDDVQKLRETMELFLLTANSEARLNNVSDSLEQNYDGGRITAKNTKIKIEEKLLEIEAQLQKIEALSIDDKDRIDRIQVTDRHLIQMDNISGLIPERREMLKKFMVSLTEMITSSYKGFIKHGHEIIEAYRNHEIIDYNVVDFRVANYKLIQYMFKSNHYDDILKFMMQETYNFSVLEGEMKVYLYLMQMYSNYINEKEFDKKEVDEFYIYINSNAGDNLRDKFSMNMVFYERLTNLLVDASSKNPNLNVTSYGR